jgi:carbonic anhydrase/acetyltransferase-like protein (isoleucine patch superfamily)
VELAVPHIDAAAFVAPTAQLHGDVSIAEGAVIMFGVVARAEFDRIVVGRFTNVQDNTVLHCDAGIPCVIGSRTTVGHAAVVHGATVGDHCLIGIGARVLNHAEVGEGAWIAAGSLLPEGKKIPPWTLAVGTPARPVRELTEAEVARQRRGVEDYLRIAAAYRSGGAGDRTV